ncbi:MAG: HD domain-containing protein [Deltaproteobacteria bacterium]|jgi:response regulator RpfG family c-di-GMP phosphodiesterase|nr:HD domain-containing protein [Deltaproteobacteria bacterium]
MAQENLAAISEDYYQISEAVLSSFPKYRLPLDLFLLQEEVVLLVPYYKKETRLSNEQVEEMHENCKQGLLFVARSDHPIYSQHIVKQLDLALQDQNLKESEVADIFIRALSLRLAEFFEQPVKVVFDRIYEDCLVFTEFLWIDRHRIKLFMRRLHKGDHSLINHTLNTMFAGLWLFMRIKGAELARKELDNHALGFLLHDVGMTKVPAFITAKNTPLKQDEKEKIPKHVFAGADVMRKMELLDDDALALCLEHHERMDGSGYPQKMNSSRISRSGAICAVADSFSAMIQKRPYAEAKPPLEAAKELADDARYDRQISTALFSDIFSGSFGKEI